MTRRSRGRLEPLTLALTGVALAALIAPTSTLAGSRQPTQTGYTLEVSSTKRWGCSRGGGSRSVNGMVKLVIDRDRAQLAVDLKGATTSYRRYWGQRRGKRPTRPSFSRSALAFKKTYQGSIKLLRNGWEIKLYEPAGRVLVTNPKAPGVKVVKTAFTLRCEQTKMKVRPAPTPGRSLTSAISPASQSVLALQCSTSGRVPRLLRDALIKRLLRLGEGKGLKLISNGRYTTHGTYYARR